MPETPEQVHFFVDGEQCLAYAGDSIAVALYRSGKRAWRRSRAGDARGLLCGMGTCYDCLLTVEGVPDLRACQVLVREGMEVRTGLPNETVNDH